MLNLLLLLRFFPCSSFLTHVAAFPAAIAPDRRADIANCGIRALVAASAACFMTACIAGDCVLPLAPPCADERQNPEELGFPRRILITIFGAHFHEYSRPYVILTAKTTVRWRNIHAVIFTELFLSWSFCPQRKSWIIWKPLNWLTLVFCFNYKLYFKALLLFKISVSLCF